jgi:excisionase family DNA binding protein
LSNNNHDQSTNGAYLRFEMPEDLLEIVARRAAELVDRQQETEPWIGVTDAAEHLACPTSRIYALVSARRIPFHKDGSRLLFKRSELDEWVRQGGAVRP